MSSSHILSIVTFIYGLAAFLYLFEWVFKKSAAGRMATVVAILGLTGNTAGIFRLVHHFAAPVYRMEI